MKHPLRAFAIEMLALAEEFYLIAHGWEKVVVADGKPAVWNAPASYPFRKRTELARGHAVNSQKNLEKYNRSKEVAELVRKETAQVCDSPKAVKEQFDE